MALTLASRLAVAYYLASDAPGDGVVYARLAKNLLEHSVFSTDTELPLSPTLVRMPGYPIFIAAVYSVFGNDNNTAVRLVQAVFDTGTCVLIGLFASLWTPDPRRKRRNSVLAFLLAAVCPFIVIYTAVILTETLTTFLMVATTVTATFAFKALLGWKRASWWAITGLLAGLSVTLRPDSGLFAGGLGLTIVISEFFLHRDGTQNFGGRVARATWRGAVLSIAFLLVLTPWAIRNYRLFGVFQPLSPAHAEMPGEFVAHGYFRWLRTWVDDSRFIEPTLWDLGEKPIELRTIPAVDFDNDEEHDRVAALLHQYNHPPGTNNPLTDEEQEAADAQSTEEDPDMEQSDGSSEENSEADQPDDQTADEEQDSEAEEEEKRFTVRMTPDIDAEFARIADERIARSPSRYYLFLPAKRAAALWFDSHSVYYPFGGQLSPVKDLDYDEDQQYWLPLFVAIMWIYTALAIGGVMYFWRHRGEGRMLQWLVLLGLMTLPRLIFFSTVENPEPRYAVELFAFTAVLAAFFLGNFRWPRKRRVWDVFSAADRLISLDVFRGVTIAAMTLVNEPGTWSAIYPLLEHAEWNGVTPTDWIFPFFLFVVGVSISFSLSRYQGDTAVQGYVYAKVLRRSLLLFALGIFLEIFPFYNIWSGLWFMPSHLRIMGVLQRISICYLAASIIFLKNSWKSQIVIVGAILLGYWALMTLVNVPGCDVTSINDKACNLTAYVDRLILTEDHIWSQSRVFDPEGLLSTLPAIATTVIGVLIGQWLRSSARSSRKLGVLLLAAGLLGEAGYWWSLAFPMNKSLWTSSYALYTAGLATFFLAGLHWLVDLKGYKRWAMPFVVFGTNAIALYIGSSMMGKILMIAEVAAPADTTVTLQEKIFNTYFLPLGAPIDASLYHAISFVLVWLFLMWMLYRRRIFVKV